MICIDLSGLTSYCDYFVICNGTSRRHTAAVAEGVIEALRARGLRPLGLEGVTAQRWVLADFGDVILHVFDPDMRGFYDLEGMWSDAPRMLPSGELFDPRPRARAAQPAG